MSVTRTLISTAALTLAFAGGVVVSQAVDRSGAQEYDPTIDLRADPTRPTSLPQTRAASAALPDLSGIAERAVQASVNISSTRQVRVRDPFYEFYYGRNPVVPQTSLGSGVFVSNDGYVLTNSHVVQSQSAEIHVTTADNREVPAKIVGIDEYTDLAVLKVEAKNTPSIPWGDSDRLRVAEWVLAIGNPFQFNQTVTLGIVSAQNRRDPQGGYNDFIQTDAAINRGNSGGALVNSRGELVGINTMIYSETGGYQGIGFAVPSNLARRVMGDLIKSGQVVRGWIGNLTLRTITAEQAQRAGLGNEGGVFVSNMFDDDPAYRAGLLPRDVIVRFNQTRIADQGELQRQIANAPIGSTATLEVVRREKPLPSPPARRTLRVPVVQFPSARSR